jgi:uracil DNA glycosylase
MPQKSYSIAEVGLVVTGQSSYHKTNLGHGIIFSSPEGEIYYVSSSVLLFGAFLISI